MDWVKSGREADNSYKPVRGGAIKEKKTKKQVTVGLYLTFGDPHSPPPVWDTLH